MEAPRTAPEPPIEAALPDTSAVPTTVADLRIPPRLRAEWEAPALERWPADLRARHRDTTGDLRERRADFDGDGLSDAAFFLRNRQARSAERRDSTYAVVVVFGAGGDTLLGVFSWAEAMGTLGAGLEVYPPRTLHHLGSEEEEDIGSPVVLEHPALSLMYFGKSEVTWFWREGSFHRIWTAD